MAALSERREATVEGHFAGQAVNHSEEVNYLWSVIQSKGDINSDVTHGIQVQVPIKLKGKFHRTVVKSALLCGSECWVVKKSGTNMTDISDKMKEYRLQRFSHVMRRGEEDLVRAMLGLRG